MALAAAAMMAAPIVAQGVTSYLGSKSAKKQAEESRRAALLTAQAQQRALGTAGGRLTEAGDIYGRGVDEAAGLYGQGGDVRADYLRQALGVMQGGYDQSLGYLDPHRQAGYDAERALGGAQGFYGAEGQADALAAYRGSPSASILERVLAETGRKTAGEFSSQGLGASGAHGEELARRLSGLSLDDYWKHAGQTENIARRGADVSKYGAGLAGGYATNLGRTTAGIGDVYGGVQDKLAGLRTGLADKLAGLQGTQAGLDIQGGNVAGSGIIGASNATNKGRQAEMDYLAALLGKVGKIDLSGAFPADAVARGAPLTGWGATTTYG